MKEIPKPRSLMKYLLEPNYYTKASILWAMIETYEQNANKLERKAMLIDQAFLFLLIEAAMLVFCFSTNVYAKPAW
jgi:hypothetical protein